MRIATVQMPMAYTIANNVETILNSLGKAKTVGADVAVFPECAVIGYHRDMGAELSKESIDTALARISQQCAALSIVAVVGTPHYGDISAEKPWNAVAVFNQQGELDAVFPKLIQSRTEKHLALFTDGNPSSRMSFQLLGRTCAVLICLELCGEQDDAQARYRDIMPTLDAKPEVVFVPGIFDMAEVAGAVDVSAASAARSLAREYQTAVVVVNWPEWGGPDPVGFLGGSLTVDSQGETLRQAVPNEPDMLVVSV